jgi:hypothetical protein
LSALDVPAERRDFYFDQLVQELTLAGLEVISPRDIQAVLGIERQRQLMGCSGEQTQCLVELANALGTSGVLQGSIGRFGSDYRLNLKVISASEGKALAVFSADASGDRDVLDALHRGALALKAQLSSTLTSSEAAALYANGGVRSKAWIPAVGGGLAAIAGAICLGLASSDAGKLTNGDPGLASQTQVNTLAQQGQSLQTTGAVLLSVGAAAVVAAGAMYWFGGSDGSIAFVPQRGGVSASWAIRF